MISKGTGKECEIMKKKKGWLALPLAVCMFAVMIFSVAEAAETDVEIPAEGKNEITIINTNHITWPVIGEKPSFDLKVPEGAHYFINMVEWKTRDGKQTIWATDTFQEGEYDLYVTYEPKDGHYFAAPEAINVLPGNEIQGKPEVAVSQENSAYRIVKFSFTAKQTGEHQHDMLIVQEKLPTCTESGYRACYQCQICKKLYLDKEGTQETTVEEIVLQPLGHQFQDGICTVCGEIDPDYVKPHEHSMIHVPEKEPTCTEDGNKEYYRCESCGKLYLDQNGEQEVTKEDITQKAAGHQYKDGICTVCKEKDPDYVEPHKHMMTHVPEKQPTCIETGNKEYYQCQGCKKMYLDQAGTKETEWKKLLIPALGHKIKEIPKKDATCTEAGNKAYYQCERCKKLYLDRDGTKETSLEKITIAAKGHVYRDGRCVVCKSLVPAVKTGDYDNNYAKWVIGILISLNVIVGVIIYKKTRNAA